jgi:hypothetical protein
MNRQLHDAIDSNHKEVFIDCGRDVDILIDNVLLLRHYTIGHDGAESDRF